MTNPWRSRIVLTLVLLLASLVACESSDVTAPQGGEIIVRANPSTVIIDPDAGQVSGSTDLTATVFDEDGLAVQGVSVDFTTSAGELAIGGKQRSDANGVVHNGLSATLNDPESITVTASSATVSGEAIVTVSDLPNDKPTAEISVNPATGQNINELVTFDGSGSSDPDDNTLTCYQWEMQSNYAADLDNFVGQGLALACTPAVPGGGCAVFQGTARSVIPLSFSLPTRDRDLAGQNVPRQGLVAILRVSDNPGTGAQCTSSGPILAADRFSANIDTAGYEIECDRTDPIADAGQNQIVECSSGACTESVVLNGSSSRDDDSGIESYRWECGNGQVFTGSAEVTCTYSGPDIFSARLIVTNRCGDDAIDTVTVSITTAP